MSVNLRRHARATLDYFVKDFNTTLSDLKEAGAHIAGKRVPLYLLAGAFMLGTILGCPWQKKHHDHDTTSGSSAPVVNYVIQAKDFAGNPVQGAQLSLYGASVYNTDDGTGDLDALVAKASGYYTSNANGEFRLNLADGKYHAVIKSTGNETEKEFNLVVPGPPPNSPNKTVEVPPGNDGNFNAEGHIKYKEYYPDNDSNPENPPNRYTVGDRVKFQVFGVNNSGLEQIISFCVLDHTTTGNPNEAPVIYRGSFAVEDERLVVPAGEKTYKVLEWTIPANLKDKLGKYAIHVTWQGYDEEPWHKIGNFFLIEDTTPPTLTLIPDPTVYFTDEDIILWATVNDVPQSGTVRADQVGIASVVPVDILLDKKDGNGFQAYSGAPIIVPKYGAITEGDITQLAANSGLKIIDGKVIDLSGNVSEIASTLQIRIDINKEEADKIADIIYDSFGIGPANTPPIDWKIDYIMPYARGPPNNILCNRANLGTSAGNVGHTYNNQTLTDFEKSILEQDILDPMGGDCVKPISKSIKADFLTILTNYLQYLQEAGKF